MTCDACANSVQKNLQSIEGVREATVNRERKSAVIKTERDISDNEIYKAFEDLNFNIVDVKSN